MVFHPITQGCLDSYWYKNLTYYIKLNGAADA